MAGREPGRILTARRIYQCCSVQPGPDVLRRYTLDGLELPLPDKDRNVDVAVVGTAAAVHSTDDHHNISDGGNTLDLPKAQLGGV